MSATISNKRTEDVRNDILDEMAFDPTVTVRDLSIFVDTDRSVTLYGNVDSYGMRLAAENAAWRVWGVTRVINDIHIDPIAVDNDIATDLKQRLDKDFLVPKGRIQFTVVEGVVTLKGVVNWHFQREAAREEAEDTWGVRAVLNEIEIDQSFATPKQIDADIRKALARSAHVDAANLTVVADGGHVTLSGVVRSFTERREAENAAWRAQGITEVTNNIIVQPV